MEIPHFFLEIISWEKKNEYFANIRSYRKFSDSDSESISTFDMVNYCKEIALLYNCDYIQCFDNATIEIEKNKYFNLSLRNFLNGEKEKSYYYTKYGFKKVYIPNFIYTFDSKTELIKASTELLKIFKKYNYKKLIFYIENDEIENDYQKLIFGEKIFEVFKKILKNFKKWYINNLTNLLYDNFFFNFYLPAKIYKENELLFDNPAFNYLRIFLMGRDVKNRIDLKLK